MALLRRVMGAALVVRLELRDSLPADAGQVLLAWLHRPAIEMPLRALKSTQLRRRLDEVFPF